MTQTDFNAMGNTHASLNRAWKRLVEARIKGERVEIQNAMMHYFQTLQVVYETAQMAASMGIK